MISSRVLDGVLEELTTARRAGAPAAPIRVGSVRIEGGGRLIARVEAELVEGAHVALDDDGGAAVARRRVPADA